MTDFRKFSSLKCIAGAALAILGSFGCSDMETADPSAESESLISSTQIELVTATTARLSVELNLSPEELSSTSVVVYYSDDSDLDVDDAESISSTKISASGKCDLTIGGLRFATPYKYIVYVLTESSEEACEPSEFRTNDINVSLTIDEFSVNSTSAVVNGTVTGISGIDREHLEFGITVSGSSDCPVSLSGNESVFQAVIEDLNYGTEYTLTPYVRQYDSVISGKETVRFTTKDNYSNASKSLDMASAADLSSRETANSYIVSEEGLYKFKTVKGCKNESVGAVAGCAILWESFGTSVAPECCDLINSVCYKDGYIAFQTSDVYRSGNAVIAAVDSHGTVLWSWHIWFTEAPADCYFANNTKALMDRNLGATSALPGDSGTLGLLYQWGRKDPFLSSSSISENIPARSTIVWPDAVKHSKITGTIGFAVANPTVFIGYNIDTKDWMYNQDDTRWSAVKTEYDPCPPGYRVPDGGHDGAFKKAGLSGWLSFNGTNKGMMFGTLNPASWFPASGFRYFDDASIGYVGVDGYYWSVTPSQTDGYYMYFNYGGYVDPAFSNYRSFGFAVRCQKK